MDSLPSKHFLQIPVAQGQNPLLRFSVFEASLIVDMCRWQRISIVSPAWMGERCMKGAVHRGVHRSVHRHSERKFLETQRLHTTRRWILDTGKTPCRAGATPVRCHETVAVAPAQHNSLRCLARVPSRILDEIGEEEGE